MPEPNDPKIVDTVVEPVDPQGNVEPKDPKTEITEPKQTVPLSDLISERKKRQDLEKRLDTIEKDKEAQKTKEMEEKQQFKELADKYKTDFEKLKSELEPDALAYRAYKEKELEEIKELLGDDWDDNMKNLPPETLKKLVAKKIPDKVADTDGAGIKVNVKKLIDQLTEAERKEAQRMNLRLEDYIELKLKFKKKE